METNIFITKRDSSFYLDCALIFQNALKEIRKKSYPILNQKEYAIYNEADRALIAVEKKFLEEHLKQEKT